jgi:hypothetical protein
MLDDRGITFVLKEEKGSYILDYEIDPDVPSGIQFALLNQRHK